MYKHSCIVLPYVVQHHKFNNQSRLSHYYVSCENCKRLKWLQQASKFKMSLHLDFFL